MTDGSSQDAIIVCPLEFERKSLLRAGLNDAARIECCGPGAKGVVSWAEKIGPSEDFFILAGLAGSLRESFQPGRAYSISTVIARDGRQFRSAIGPTGDDETRTIRAVVASPETCLSTVSEKQAFAEKTGADLVDLESGLFAEAATMFGWRWSIVRGVSDGLATALPPHVEQWVGRNGRTRVMRATGGLLRRPWFLPTMMGVRADAIAAMIGVAELARTVISRSATD